MGQLDALRESMAKRKNNSRAKDYRHDEKVKNNPPIGMVSYEPKSANRK